MLANRTKYLLTPGFAVVLGLMVIVYFVGLSSMASIQNRLKVIVENHNVKTAQVTSMRNAARERTISLYRMITLADPFERDEEFMRFNHFAAEFAQARIALLAMSLSQDEEAILKRQGELTGTAVALQERVIDLAMGDELEAAGDLLYEQTIPAQDRVFDQLTKLLDIQKNATQRAVEEATHAYDRARTMMFMLGFVTLLLGSLIAIFVVRRSTQAETKLYREKERVLVTLQSIGEGVVTTDAKGNIEFINPVASKLTGWNNKEAFGLPLLQVLKIAEDVNNQALLPNPVEKAIQENRIVNSHNQCILTRRDGKEFAIEHTAAPIRDHNSSIIGAILVFRNITAMRNMAQQMAYQASHDALTGLINRHEFEQRLDLALQSARSENREHALCYMDLDQFKVVNDTCGHIAGDELLKQLATILHNNARKSDTLARLGGDEFALLLVDCTVDQAQRISEALRQAINDFRFNWKDKSFEVSSSMGLVGITPESGSITDILSAADSACYIAKDLGRNRMHVYQPDDSAVAMRHGEMQWLQRIRGALEKNALVLYFQRIIPLFQGEPNKASYEILIRLKDDEDTLVPPMAFLPAAERYGLMPMVDRWVIQSAFRFLKENAANHAVSQATWSINVSGQTLCDDTFLEFVVEQLKLSKVSTRHICFEITETAAIANLSRATQFISTLKDMGCHFALDDFGSGLSSFTYLKNLPVDYLKIDGSFVKDMLDDPMDLAMVESINQIGHIMGLKTIDKLKSLRVDFAQGYGIHKPEPLQRLAARSNLVSRKGLGARTTC
jgi:diguanylate cyclase (GGDEF)-like protein/PAS domain S-box-containing protein